MNYSDIQHRFANKLEGKNGCIKASNVRYEGRNYFSYSTVFGQWLDMEKNVVAIFDGGTSSSSSKHKLGKWCFPDDVHVFPLDFGGGYYGLRNCELVGYNSKDSDFKEYHRMQMIDHYVGRIYDQIAAINGGKSKGLENVDFSAWGYVEELCSLYKDTTINKYLKTLKHIKPLKKDGQVMNKKQKEHIKKCNAEIDAKKVMVKLLAAGERNVHTLTDALFGEGTFDAYWNYCARYRKQSDKREKMEMLCERLGIGSPYVSYRGYHNNLSHEMSADDIRKLTAKERVEWHFRALEYKEYKEHEDERKKAYNKRKDNAYRWIVGFEPVIDSSYSHSYKLCTKVRNMHTGEVYEVGGDHIFGFYWLNKGISFDYDNFRKSEDKEQWIREFYAKCREVANNRKAIGILKRIKAHIKEKMHSWDDDVFISDNYLRENTTEAEYAICSEFIRKQDKHYADEAARERAREIERLRREEEERKEKEYQARVKQEQIDECLERGEEGCRDLWRKHLMDIHYAERETNYKGDFFMGGNVLLRLNLNKDKVETSKDIRIPVDICKKMWKIVSKWHENPKSFKPMQIDTKGSGKYTISSYENDILTAGCHKIAFVEMERMYNEIINA